MSANLRRDFEDRDDLIGYLREQFPAAAQVSPEVTEQRGGRAEALRRLHAIDPGTQYAKTRNHLSGVVTRLSAYIRHGVLSLAEVRDYALTQVSSAYDADKFVSELATRDYWQRVYQSLGDGIWENQEAYKTGYDSADYSPDLPNDIQAGTTGMVCVDSFSRDLRETGYLHNHARMWLAAYIVHWRRVQWQAGARWFLEHLLDGDPASNNLSWQWVASTFSHKPYFFNRENLETFTDGVYCQDCPLYKKCAFEGSYESLEVRLFPHAQPTARDVKSHGKDQRRGGRRG
ncbi:MAG: deoxyribodipyrimidine photo-lyase [Armatimonadetes bacterium]|nr:deoxyribodipyrimidine photo-lyase [Anaerolineae bacterium]